MNPDDLERLIGAELKRLPAPRAPRTLLPRVLATTAGDHQLGSPAPARRWAPSPPAWQSALVILVAAAACAVVLASSRLSSWTGATGALATLLAGLDLTSALVRVSWRVLLAPLAFSVMAAAVILSLGCAALWSALNRFALGGASES